MLTRVGALLVVAWCFSGLLGCVSADVYRVKEREVQSLLRTNEEMHAQNRSLFAEKTKLDIRAVEKEKENEGLQERIKRQSEEIANLKIHAKKLEKDGEGLRERMEKLNAKIAELNKDNQRLAALSRPENLLRTLGERLGDLQKQVEALAGENEKLKNEQIIARFEQKKPGGTEEERTIKEDRTIKTEGEKPQAVPVSARQKAEDSKPEPQQQEEPEQPMASEDREKPSEKP